MNFVIISTMLASTVAAPVADPAITFPTCLENVALPAVAVSSCFEGCLATCALPEPVAVIVRSTSLIAEINALPVALPCSSLIAPFESDAVAAAAAESRSEGRLSTDASPDAPALIALLGARAIVASAKPVAVNCRSGVFTTLAPPVEALLTLVAGCFKSEAAPLPPAARNLKGLRINAAAPVAIALIVCMTTFTSVSVAEPIALGATDLLGCFSKLAITLAIANRILFGCAVSAGAPAAELLSSFPGEREIVTIDPDAAFRFPDGLFVIVAAPLPSTESGLSARLTRLANPLLEIERSFPGFFIKLATPVAAADMS